MKSVRGQSLPVSEYRDAITRALAQHQVIIVAGETGSGKSLMLPVYLREVLSGNAGRVAVTEPRRIAAVSLAGYCARLDGSPLGKFVGYIVRYRKKISPRGRICYMTDGILMAELIRNPLLKGYAGVMIDEVHERSVTIDYLLGYMRQLFHHRPDLKLVIASATIATRFFSRLFPDSQVLHISTRRYPVEYRYQPVVQLWRGVGIDSYIEGVIITVEQLCTSGEPGDILAFLPTVDDVGEAVRRLQGRVKDPRIRVLPLHGRLSFRQQEEVFTRFGGRTVIIATNIAETSITVPGIRIVIDSGLVRMLRYTPEASLSRMPVEKIAQSAAAQRAGRCGRTTDGICIRLYSEQDLHARPRFTTPEIKRSNLAGLVLRQLVHSGVKPEHFPFPDRPIPRMLSEGYRQLRELGAVDRARKLTRFGYAMAHFPLDPPVACMLLRARRFDVVHEVLVIAAALSATDPLTVTEGKSPSVLKSFRHRESDFMTFLSVWRHIREGDKVAPGSGIRRFAARYHLHVNRLQEWSDAYGHIRRIYEDFYGSLPELSPKPSYADIHKCLLSGLIHGVAHVNNDGSYTGVQTEHIRVAAVSSVAGKRFPWLLFHELIETERVYGARAARIEPKWIEALFRQECTYRYKDPWYDDVTGEVMVREEVSFKHLLLVKNRIRICRSVDRALAREVFIREALVGGMVGDRYLFIRYNRELKERILAAEQKLRMSLYAGDAMLEALYADAPADVVSRKELNAFLHQKGHERCLMADEETLVAEALPDDIAEYTDTVIVAQWRLEVTWLHAPDMDKDGAVVTIPDACAAALPVWYWQWVLPVLNRKRLEMLVLRLAPELLERKWDPADVVDNMQVHLSSPRGSWLTACRNELVERYGIPEACVEEVLFPPWLWPAVRVVDDKGIIRAFFRSSEYLHRDEPFTFNGGDHMRFVPEQKGETGDEYMPLLESIPAASEGQLVPVTLWYGLHSDGSGRSVKGFTARNWAVSSHASVLTTLCENDCAEELSWEIEKVNVSKMDAGTLTDCLHCNDSTALAVRLMLKSILTLPPVLPVRTQDITTLIAEVKDRISGRAVATVTLLSELADAIRQQEQSIARKKKRHRDNGSIQVLEMFREELDGFRASVLDNTVSFHFIEQIPLYLKVFSQRIDAALLEPRSFRSLAAVFSECHLLIASCGAVTDFLLAGERERLRVALEEFKLTLVRKNISPRRALTMTGEIERRKNALEQMYQEFLRL